jgi:SAM-dependent MidA family methyltransferase
MIRSEIEHEGPISFARFMELALYEPEHGYYRAGTARPGREGDFLTAPESNPIFGRALARHLEDVWAALGRPADFRLREHGAGGGALAEAILAGLKADRTELGDIIRYRPVEVEPRRIAELRRRLDEAGLAGAVEIDDGSPIAGVVLANEVLDALPTHRVVQRGSTLREILVGWDRGSFVDVEADPTSESLGDRLRSGRVVLADGQRAEICLAVDAWIESAAAGLARGVLLVIDYGHPAERLYDPVRRAGGTLAAYLLHRAHDDPYRAVGRQDLTAHVDVTAVERAAVRAGLVHLATTTQGRFLDSLGAGELLIELQSGPVAGLQSYLEARSSLVRMIDPAVMGGFAVMAFGRDLLPGAALRGLG